MIAAEAGRLERLVGDVLDLAKLDTRRFTVLHEEVDMARLVEQAYAAFGEEAKSRKIDYSQDVSSEPGDRHRRRPRPADHHEPARERVPLDAGRGARRSARCTRRTARSAWPSRTAGPESAPEEQDRIFRPFWTHDGKGTGLGLAIARELAVALGGTIELESELGRGSRFELVLPARH